MQPKHLSSRTEREIARYVRDGQWAFMERIQAVGKLWFCVWNKDRRHQKPYPADLWVCCLMTGLDYENWMQRHPDWFIKGRWSEKRYARSVRLTPAGVAALANRNLYDMEPLHGGLVEPGYTVLPLRPAQRKREFDISCVTGPLS